MQILVLLKCILSNQNVSVFKDITETLESWKILLQKMSTNPKMYDLSPCSKSTLILMYSYFLVVKYVSSCILTWNELNINYKSIVPPGINKHWMLVFQIIWNFCRIFKKIDFNPKK